MCPYASVLSPLIPGNKLVLASDTFLSKSSFSQANALMSVAVRCRLSLVAARNQPLLQCHSDRGSSFPILTTSQIGEHIGSKFSTKMAPVIQGTTIVIMGVCGAGKSTIGNLLAEAMNCKFLDADDFHPDSNKVKMKNGIPLSDEDRIPWLETLCNKLKECTGDGNNVVLACSALRKPYRDILRSVNPHQNPGNHCSSVKFILLDVPINVLGDRLKKRANNGEHFMPPSLLQSQLEALEIDSSEGIHGVDATQSPWEVVGAIQDLLSQNGITCIS